MGGAPGVLAPGVLAPGVLAPGRALVLREVVRVAAPWGVWWPPPWCRRGRCCGAPWPSPTSARLAGAGVVEALLELLVRTACEPNLLGVAGKLLSVGRTGQ